MAAQFISRGEFDNGINGLYRDMTRYFDARFDSLNRQVLADRTDTLERFVRIERNIASITDLLQGLAQSLVRVDNNAQQGFAQTQQRFTELSQSIADLRQEMRDGFAAQAERHNELMQRVARLEGRETPNDEA